MMSEKGLLAGRKGLIMGVANNHSIAWGIAQAAAGAGAELAFTYQGEGFRRRVEPLAKSVGSDLILPCDVQDPETIDATFDALKKQWGTLDFLVHAIAYSDRTELKGRYVDTSAENFAHTMNISCYSLAAVTRRAEPLMRKENNGAGGSIITLTYLGAERVMPNYNVMGVAKAALEASVRYLAADLGEHGIRVNAISAGPMRTLAGSAIADARYVFRFSADNSPLKRNVLMEEVGGAALYLMSPLSGGVTGETHHVDGGFHAIGMPRPGRHEQDPK